MTQSPDERERARIEGVYARYARSGRRRRAWSLERAGTRAMRQELVGSLVRAAGPALAAGSVLDVGCGSGWWLRELAHRGVEPTRLHGIDVLRSRIDAAACRLPGADVRLGDALALPYADGSFSLVTFILVLGSIAGRARVVGAVEEGARVLAPGGRLLVYEPRYPNPLNRHTALVPGDVLDDALGRPAIRETLTVIPPLARRLGPLTGRLYPRLAACSPLLSHRLTAHQPAA